MSKEENKTLEPTRCHHCRKDLSTVSEVHAAEGMLFCSRQCAIDHQVEVLIASVKEQAAEWYNEYAEVVAPEDIGITEDTQPVCEWCECETDEDMLTRTDLGMLCNRCIAAIRSRGEQITLFEGGY